MASLKGGSLRLDAVDVPSSVEAGRTVTAEVTVVNDATVISPWDPDQCSSGGFGSNYGYETTVVFTAPDGSTQSKTACVVSDDFHAGEEVFTFTFDAPNQGGNVDVSARLETSEASTGDVSSTLVVGGQDPAEPDDDDGGLWGGLPDGDGGGGGEDGDNNPFSFGLELGAQEKAALGLLIVLIAAAVLRPYASMGASAAEVAT